MESRKALRNNSGGNFTIVVKRNQIFNPINSTVSYEISAN